MNLKHVRAYLVLCSLVVGLQPIQGLTRHSDESKPSIQKTATERDGQHDFDFEIGTWKTHLKRLLHPLTGSTTWVEYEGTSVVRKVWNGRANLVELEADGPEGHVQGLSLRLYNPDARQWSLNFSNSAGGTLSPPVFGEFKNGSRVFFGQDSPRPRPTPLPFLI